MASNHLHGGEMKEEAISNKEVHLEDDDGTLIDMKSTVTNEDDVKEKNDLKNEEEYAIINDVTDEAKAEVINEEANSHVQATYIDVTKDAVRDKVKAEARDHVQPTYMDETKDSKGDEVKAEANKETRDHAQDVMIEANVKCMDETKDTIKDEVKAEAYEETTDDTKDTVSNEAEDTGCGDTKSNSITLSIDAEIDDDRDGIKCKRSDEAWTETEDYHHETKDDSSISIDENIWRYILKTKDWSSRMRCLKEELDTEIEESTSTDGMILRVSGSIRSNVEQAEVALRNVISECQDVVGTTEVPCEDQKVHSKVVRLMKSINKLPCFVSAAPDLLRVTGTKDEIRSCLEKLYIYGVRYELEREDITPDEEFHILEEQREPQQFTIPPLDNWSQQDNLSRELPVPIEKHLWNFIRVKRKSDLRGIEEALGVTISTKPRNDVSTVSVSISIPSLDNIELLDAAQQVLGQLLERLGSQVAVICVLGGEEVAQLPKEGLNTLRQELADVDLNVEIIESSNGQRPGHRLLIVGPDKEIALSQQTIQRTLHKLFSSVDPALFIENDTFGGNSNNQQIFPGSGDRLGSKDSLRFAKEDHSNHSHHGHAGPTRATGGGPPFRDNASTTSERLGPARPNYSVDRTSVESNLSEQNLEPTLGRESPLQLPGSSMTQATNSYSSDSSIDSRKSSEWHTEHSKTEGETAKVKKVTFSDPDDGIRVYPTSTSSPPSYQSLDPSKTDTESAAMNRPEEKDTGHRLEKTGIGSRDNMSSHDRHRSQCSTCKDVSDGHRVNGCTHVLCLSCVRDYIDPLATCCPLCGNSRSPTATAATQPIGGQMLITYNNAFCLPGLENKSKGVIVITYVFKQGHQTDDCQNPGKKYPGLTKTAFLPLSPIGWEVVDHLQKAFEARVTFRFASTLTHPSGELVWNDILHKESIYGGPIVDGYPDPVYMDRVRQDLLAKGFH